MKTEMKDKKNLALLGGEPLIKEAAPAELFKWPILTDEDREAVMYVVENNRYSHTDITIKFQDEFAAWQGRKYALAFTNGTMSLAAAMFGIGLSAGDEIICPTKTYWASVSQAKTFGAKVVFCNINDMLSLDPDDLERCITPRTKAIMVVHYVGYPCDMDRIMEIANKHGIPVIEDCSHSQGSLYKGKKTGNFGKVAAMSMMSGKSFAAGEMGMLVTDDVEVYERAIAYGHYERNNEKYITETEYLKDFYHIPLGGVKGRVNQVCSALGRGQLKYFDQRCAEIRRAMNYFYDLIDDIPGITPVRVDESTGSTMGGFYCPLCVYDPEKFGGLSSKRFADALRAEFNGAFCSWEGGNFCLHTHPYFDRYDYFKGGKDAVLEDRGEREEDKILAPSVAKSCFSVPWFKHCDKEWIEKYAAVFRKIAENYEELLEGDTDKEQGGRWHGQENEDVQKKKK